MKKAKIKKRVKIRSWMAHRMIVNRIGTNSAGPMRDRRDRRAKEHEKDWEDEEWE